MADTARSSQWTLPPPADVNARLIEAVGGDALVARILAQRGYTSPDAARAFLDPAYYRSAPSSDLPDLDRAADLLDDALHAGRTILIWGDFDVDGQASTALLVEALRGLDGQVIFTLPERSRRSHGVHRADLTDLVAQHRPGLLLTCDTGVSSHDAIAYARQAGITTIITDHHTLPDPLPDSDAIVNPHRLPDNHPLAALPGVGVAYKLIEQLYTLRGRVRDLPRFLDLVALGIVADVSPQVDDTRTLLQLGLRQMQTAPRVGLRALADVAGLAAETLTAGDLAFDLAPRLNAAGRLADATLGVDLLLADDLAQARILAAQVDGLNRQRRALQSDVLADIQRQMEANLSLLDRPALLLSSETWHPGVIGPAAGQLAEELQRPVFLLNASGNPIRGSARSVPGYDVHAALSAVQDRLVSFGGHSRAAGFALRATDLEAFRERLFAALERMQPDVDLPAIAIDAIVSLAELTPTLANRLQQIAPFGEGNPPVTFMVTDLTLRSAAFVDRARQHRRLTVQDPSGMRQPLIWWRSAHRVLPADAFDAAIQFDWRTRATTSGEPQLILLDFRRAASALPEVPAPRREVIDCRASPDPLRALDALKRDYPDAAIWAEGIPAATSPGRPLHQLERAPTLIVYTTPPAAGRLNEALKRTQPERVALVAAPPPLQTLADLQRRLLELCKYVIGRLHGSTTLDDLAGALAQTPGVVRDLLDLAAAQGEIGVSYATNVVMIAPGTGIRDASLDDQRARTLAHLGETAAYRTFFRRAAPHALLGWDET
ncbi:single-stranded-DNA-specific exonuclease RecJ [Aggregatilinea lenta]|uniref:single-stranded-DNA-specific exonuclease RecJ n=1 Tax=Aggregatilinea lenta TaxID=913108 RepID=UPI000E5C380D|nr:single-stranded-DNA-specific exonuclease RecJ [Aggregatilinea lenta]